MSSWERRQEALLFLSLVKFVSQGFDFLKFLRIDARIVISLQRRDLLHIHTYLC